MDTLPGTYTRVMFPTEFYDSLLIVPDLGERLMWRINLRDGTRSPFASQGGGPGEYARAGWSARVHRDSVVVFAGFANEPFPVIDVSSGRGRTHAPIAYSLGSGAEGVLLSVSAPNFRFADTLGHVYGAPLLAPPARDEATGRLVPPTSRPDTTPVVRYSLRTERVDTVTRYQSSSQPMTATRGADGVPRREMPLGAYGADSEWHVMAGGEVLVVDGETYSVRVFSDSSNDVREFSIPFTPVPVSDSGWDAHVQRTTKGNAAFLEKSVRDMSVQMGRPMPTPTATQYTVPGKPTHLPPNNFGGNKHMHSAAGMVWIPVHRAEPPLAMFYDIVDVARGARVTTVALPARHRLLHVTSVGAYVATIDDDDLERILLYRRPSQ